MEASHRHFYRVRSNGSNRSWVAMWSPPTLENNQQFAVLAQVFQAIGTPQLLASDFERGFFLMEDLGNLHLSDAYESAAGDTLALQRLVESALDALLPLQKIADSAIPPYDEARLIMEFDLCAEWFAEQLIQTNQGRQTPIPLQPRAVRWYRLCWNSPKPAFIGTITAAICCYAATQANSARSA